MRMSCAALLFLTAALLAIGCHAHFGENKVIHVGGKVMCQDCSKDWSEWIHGARPLKGCKVSVTCLDNRYRVVHYGVDKTDEQGVFQLVVDRHIINGKKLDATGCLVRLMSSPHEDCNVMTDFAGGKAGVRLSWPSLVYRDLVEYTLGPFYFTSPMCKEPDESPKPESGYYDDDDDDDDDNE